MTSLPWQPNADQQRAIETLSGFCVVLAGPGTGKTETLAAKTTRILQQDGTPLAVTYTRAAAQELIHRLGPHHERVTACTCHSLAFKLFVRLVPTVGEHIPRLLDTRRHEREAITATIHDQAGNRQRAVVTRTTPCDPTVRYPKEEALLELLRRERARGRKVLVFAIHTDQRDILPRLISQAAQDGMRLAALRASGDARTRKHQLQRLLAQGADGIVCHPRLVQTGLNLTQFPTIAFIQFDYSTFTLRQASRRSYRPSQTQPVEVHFFCYTGTVQEKGLALMARKLRSALMAEGEFVDDGLSAFADDGDITRELMRSLLHGHAIPGLEATFAALRALRATTEAPVPAAPPPPTVNRPPHAVPITPERATGLVRPVPVPSADDHARAVQQLEALRAQKQAVLAQRKRITVARTLAGNPGQLNLFEEE